MSNVLVAISAILIFLYVAYTGFVTLHGVHEIEYRGEKFKLSKAYITYDAYKNDRNNISPSEATRIEEIMAAIRIEPEFQNWTDFARATSDIKFPGYGLGPSPPISVSGSPRKFLSRAIEIPMKHKSRYFVVDVSTEGRVRLVDDFIEDADPFKASESDIRTIEYSDGILTYRDSQSRVLRRTQID